MTHTPPLVADPINNGAEVTVYATEHCQKCRQTSRGLTRRAIAHEYVYVDAPGNEDRDRHARSVAQQIGGSSFPIVEVTIGGEQFAAWSDMQATAMDHLRDRLTAAGVHDLDDVADDLAA